MNPDLEAYPLPPFCRDPKRYGIMDQMCQYEVWRERIGHLIRLNDKYGKLYSVAEVVLPLLQPRYHYPGVKKVDYFPVTSLVLRPREGLNAFKWYPLPPYDENAVRIGPDGLLELKSSQAPSKRFTYYGHPDELGLHRLRRKTTL